MKQNFFNRLRARSDWKNLYCVGDSTTMGEGVISATVSGVGAANRLLEDLGFPIYVYREFARQQVNLIRGRPWTPPPEATDAISEDNAGRAARECQHCESPACRDACPAGIDTCSFARRIEAGNLIGAARVLRDVNPFSEVCGHICPSDRFCERKCNRHEFSDSPVRIRELHGWVCGRVSGSEGWDRCLAPPTGKRVAVVGAGPAGLTAAHYLARMGYGVDIMDKARKPGGVLSHAVPAFRLPEGIVRREIQGLTLPGMRFQYDQTLGKDFTVADLQRQYAAVFLAPGLGTGRMLDLPGGRRSKQIDALDFLSTYREKGRVKVDKRVVVIGGGSVAVDAATVARKFGAGDVVLVCLEQAHEMPCSPSEQEGLKALGIRTENGWGPREFVSDSRLSFVGCTSVFDDAGRFHPCFDEQQTMEIALDQVIVAIGQTVEPSLADCLKRDLGADVPLPVDKETLQVKGHPGVYAGGDIIRGAGTVVEAVADGRRAAQGMDRTIKRRPHA
jgi:NADPH-dependent glutamate synthase beta subunit-like oxidoreductase